ncbi:CehA/McbA family metallohydrolase [bacterium]|nr:CehA/McbA family metallohydrolase [bacterium]
MEFYKYMAGLHAVRKNIGKARIIPMKVEVDSFSTFRIIYTCGEVEIKKGGTIKIGIPHAFSTPQIDNPSGEGYVRIKMPKNLKFTSFIDINMSSGLTRNGHVGSWTKDIFIKLEEGKLRKGEKIEIIYGDKTEGGPGAKTPYFTQWFEFTVGVDPEGKRKAPYTGFWLLEKQPKVYTITNKVNRLQIYVPTLVSKGELFNLKIIPKDDKNNMVSSYKEKPELIVEDGSAIRIERNVNKFLQAKLKTKKEGVYRILVKDLQNGVEGISNPLWAKKEKAEYRVYWGDLHAHTFFTDGLGTIKEAYKYARDVACLDFCSVADHSNFVASLWKDFVSIADEFNEEGKFITLYGYEVTTKEGDVNIYYRRKYPHYQMKREGNYWNIKSIKDLDDFLKNKECIVIPHLHDGHNWDYPMDEKRRLVEIYSCWGNHEYKGCPYPSYGNVKNDSYVFSALNKGRKIGITAGSDSHAGHPGDSDWLRVSRSYHGGLTAVYAEELTRESLWEALWNRRCYATTGARIYLDFQINGHRMGEEIEINEEKIKIKIEVASTKGEPHVDLIKNGNILQSWPFEPLSTFPYPDRPNYKFARKYEFEDKLIERKKTVWYLVRVTQIDGQMAWSSPIWVNRK